MKVIATEQQKIAEAKLIAQEARKQRLAKLYEESSDDEQFTSGDQMNKNLMAYMEKVEKHLMTEMSLIKTFQDQAKTAAPWIFLFK